SGPSGACAIGPLARSHQLPTLRHRRHSLKADCEPWLTPLGRFTKVAKLLVYKTDVFERWFAGIADRKARVRVQARVDRLETGHCGDVEPVGEGVSELRIFHGPGYRIYFVRPSPSMVILLNG